VLDGRGRRVFPRNQQEIWNVLAADAQYHLVRAALGPLDTSRDLTLWPFDQRSIWNLSIGQLAQYVFAGIRHPTAASFFADSDIFTLTPSAPSTTVFVNTDDWGGGSRCGVQGGSLFSAPIPTNFVVPGANSGSPDGSTPNACAAFLAADGHTIIQTQPFARCVAGQPPTSHYLFGQEDLFGLGETGSHGGSALSALGGTIRLGELVPPGYGGYGIGVIRHAMKLNIDEINFYPGFSGYRWPARKSDAGGAGYGGSIPECRMGSLLALRPDFNIAGLESEPGKILARGLMDYGAYNCDSAGWSAFGIPTERSPAGNVIDEFQAAWKFPLNASPGQNGWARDCDKIATSLYVVNNWDFPSWQVISATGGLQGVGGGTPRQPWADQIVVPPPPPPGPPPPPPPPVPQIDPFLIAGAAVLAVGTAVVGLSLANPPRRA